MSNEGGESKEEKELLGLQIGKFGRRWILWMFAVIILLIAIYALWFGLIKEYKLSDDPESWAQFGDFIAGVAGPFIGFVSIIFVLETLNLQRKQIKQATEEMTKQNGILHLQSIEQSFFTWLSAYGKQVEGLKFEVNRDGENKWAKGTEALHFSVKSICFIRLYGFDSGTWKLFNNYSEFEKEVTGRVNDHFFGKSTFNVHGCFSNLFMLISWIDGHASLIPSQKWHYVSIIKSNLSNVELVAILLYSMTNEGERVVSYIKKYALLHDMIEGPYVNVRFARIHAEENGYGRASFQAFEAKSKFFETFS